NCNPQFPPGICCGTATSAFWSYYNGGGANDQNVNDDYLALRMRVNGDPRDSTGNCLSPSHWNFLHDFDEDGFKEWWYDAWGNQNEIRILFENIQSQQVTNDNPAPAPGTLINLLTACAVTAPALNQTSCGPGSARRECFYSHSRVCGVPALAADLLNPSVCRQGSTDATGEWFVEVQVPINFLRTNDPPAACCTEPIPLGTQVFTSFPPSIHLFFSTSDSSTDPVQKDFIASCVTTTGPCSFSDPTPVSLSYFRAERGGAGLVFEWSTASESGNVGFDVYSAGKAGWEKLTLRPVASRKPFSLARVDYRLELPGATGERFAIEDIDLYGGRRMHGPFALDKTYGLREPVATFDWSGVRAEHASRVTARAAASRTGARPGVRGTAPARLAELLVDRDGAYRVTHEQLLAAGFDFSGVAAADLALARDGRPVPIRVGGPARFGPGSFVEFLGAAATGVYTRTSVYRLAVDRAHAARMLPALGAAAPRADEAPASTYRATAVVNRDRAWSFAARGDDPWYEDWVPAFAGSPVERSYTFTVDHLVAGDSRLTLDLWGMTDWAQGSDHHVVVSLNGVAVGERRFDGLTDLALDLPLPAGLL
ncbi:MAG TPA: hypothetical protein VKP11_00275, partial [Frankiaceae bacterium]|nr:hypothetical protein [Frankiaceae bacterium]